MSIDALFRSCLVVGETTTVGRFSSWYPQAKHRPPFSDCRNRQWQISLFESVLELAPRAMGP